MSKWVGLRSKQSARSSRKEVPLGHRSGALLGLASRSTVNIRVLGGTMSIRHKSHHQRAQPQADEAEVEGEAERGGVVVVDGRR